MQRKIALYSFENLDGLSAAAILTRWAKKNNHKFKIDFINYQNLDSKFIEMSQLKGYMIFILDISPNEIKNITKKIDKIELNKNKIMYWNCHMEVPIELKNKLSLYIKYLDFEPTKCSASMVAKRFMPKDSIAKELECISHDVEFFLKEDERGSKLSEVITSGFSKDELVDLLSKGIYWSERLERKRKEYLAKKVKSLNYLVENTLEHYYNNKTVVFGFASSVLSTADAGESLLEAKNAEIAVSVFRDGRLSFRRTNNSEIDLSIIAQEFSGGGHPYAAGGIITDMSLPITSFDKFKVAVNHVDRKLRELL